MAGDTEAAPEAAVGKTADDQALEVLRMKWGHSYRIGHDPARDWHAQRRDGLGGDITGGDAGELEKAISDDHALKPVSPAYVKTGVTRP